MSQFYMVLRQPKFFLKCRRADELDGGRRELGMTTTFLSFHHSRKREEKKSFPDYHANLKIGSSMVVAAAFVTLQMLNWFFSLDGF